MKYISLSPATTEILCALGCEDELVAVTHLCDYPPSIKKKPKIGTWIRTEVEKLSLYDADLIFTSSYLPRELEKWEGKEKIVFVDPRTLDGVFGAIMTMARTVGKEAKGRSIVEKMKEEFRKIGDGKKSRRRPKVYMEEWHTPPFVSGNWVPDILEVSGGREDLVKPGERSREVTLDEIRHFDPDIIVCHWCGAGDIYKPEEIKNRKGWGDLRAVSEGKIYFIDDALLNTPGPRLVLGAKRLFQIIN
ncbi:cobalamin-binding protein [Candidatus Gottesmanbacteria bacterium]|nr:cobalamin-binding protein [Candidatus Gottesmanbacteria bacterium]